MSRSPPRRSTSVVARRIAGETFLVPVRGRLADLKGLYALNAVAAFIWERIDGSMDLPALAEAVSAEFEVPVAIAQADAAELLRSLLDHGFVETGTG